MEKLLLAISVFLSITLGLCGCGGGGGGSSSTPPLSNSSASSSVAIPLPKECIVNPKIVTHAQAPVISLLGDRVVTVAIGATYMDAGATATDAEDGDLSAAIKVTGLENVNTRIAADYLVRYDAIDKDQHAAQSKHRVIRVNNGITPKYTQRIFGQSNSPMGFLEHLPTYMGNDPQAKYPLIIYAHGWEHFVQQSPPAPDTLLGIMFGSNIYRVFKEDLWPNSRPFIVLEPQRCLDVGDDEWTQVDRFIDWALATYPIDSSRVYMMGLSAGGYFTYRYPVLFPNRVAAIAPMSAGGPVENGDAIEKFCSAMKTMPIWAFHGDSDKTVPLADTLYTFNVLKNCSIKPAPTPLLTVVQNGGHTIIDLIDSDLYIGQGDPNYTIQDKSIYDWLLQYSLPNK